VSVRRVVLPILSVTIVVALLATLLPAAVLAAPGGKPRQYMVVLDVEAAQGTSQPSTSARKAPRRERAKRADEVTGRIRREHGVRPSHRFGRTRDNFAASMTPAQAAELADDPDVLAVRPARVFELAGEVVPTGVQRVKAWTIGTSPGPDVNAHVAVLDTGIGYSLVDERGVLTGEPDVSAPLNSEELNIVGGVNCFDDPSTANVNEAKLHADWWADTHGHGTHVAGIIGARDNDMGVVGVAPGAKLWSVRVFEGALGTEASIVCGLDWVLERIDGGGRIDVVNMSIEGPRMDQRENCSVVRADPLGDPIQQRICELTSKGVTVVAAAGNDRINANRSSPGGFDRVISVGAMTDTDGSGWSNGPNASSCGYGSERDDTFASSYSNRGREVDILAPGTCVGSLRNRDRDVSNPEPRIMTGTSMAAPHVTGAVARYVDAFGSPASTGQMRNLVRAAGSLDWKARTDPVWSGVNDAEGDLPNRVLDVKALTGAPFLKAWIQHQRFTVGGKSIRRTTRIDLQRGGGFGLGKDDDPVRVSVNGLKAAVGRATFTDAVLEGIGRRQLGTNVRLDLGGSDNDGAYTLSFGARAVDGSGLEAKPRTLRLTIDRTGPEVTGLAPKIRGGRSGVSTAGATQTYLRWQASDELSRVSKARLQRKIDGGTWRNAGTKGKSSSRVSLKPGRSNKFRVKAVDSLGNVSFSSPVWTKLTIRDSASSRWLQPATGGWQTKRVDKAHKGSILLAKRSTDSLSTTFHGRAIAIMASVGPGRGELRVRVDGGAWYTVDLHAAKAGHRKAVWSRKLAKGSHTLEVQGVSGQATLDALLILS